MTYLLVARVPAEYPKWLRELVEATVDWVNDINAIRRGRGLPHIPIPLDLTVIQLKPLAITDGTNT